MPRKQRLDGAGVIHHATMRGVDGMAIFRSDEDRITYVLMLAATASRYRWLVLAYCLMDNHVHLLVKTTEANFGDGMQWLHGRYGSRFNVHYRRRGPLFQDRYHDEPVMNERHLITVVGYIAVNPVAARLCVDATEWDWSSHSAVHSGRVASWLAHDELAVLLEGRYERIVAAAEANVRGV